VKNVLKPIAWNNIRLKIPRSWDIGRIGTHQLIFQHDSTPKLELKWNAIKGNFSHNAHLKRLTIQQKTAPKPAVEKWTLPAEWEHALSGFTTSGFSWRSEKSIGRGVILFCPVCRNATLIQFFFKTSDEIAHISQKILESFKDHQDDGQTDWSVFDIQATLPNKFILKHHRFQPGNYALEFSNGKQIIHLMRWAPASAFLKRQSLFQFAEAVTHMAQADFSSTRVSRYPAVEAYLAPSLKNNRWFKRFLLKPVFQLWRFWHLAEKNRILGIKIEDNDAIDPHLANTICKSYDSL
jgi:hypothetical protein